MSHHPWALALHFAWHRLVAAEAVATGYLINPKHLLRGLLPSQQEERPRAYKGTGWEAVPPELIGVITRGQQSTLPHDEMPRQPRAPPLSPPRG